MAISSISFKSVETTNVDKNEKKVITPKVSSPGASIGAMAAGAVVHKIAPLPLASPIFDNMEKLGNLKGEDGTKVHNALKQMLEETKLKDKGVRIKFLTENKKLFPIKVQNKDDKILRNFIEKMHILPVRRGQNAFFSAKDYKLPKITLSEYERIAKSGDTKLLAKKFNEWGILIKANSVILPKEKLHTAGFHELGHALNYNFSSIGKFLQKCRPLSMFAPMVLGIYGAVTKKSKPKQEGQDLGGKQKFNNFLRDNAGKLAFIAGLPMLIEEGMATVKGNSFAKKLLSPELASRVSKGNGVAYCTYALVAIFGALAARVAVGIKDNAIEKKEIKAQNEARIKAELAEVV